MVTSLFCDITRKPLGTSAIFRQVVIQETENPTERKSCFKGLATISSCPVVFVFG